MPRIYKPLPGQPQEAAKALSVFNTNTLRAAVIRDLAQHLDGDTTGNIAKRIGVGTGRSRGLEALEAEGLVSAVGEVGVRNGQRIHYSIDLGRLRECGRAYMSYLSGE